MDSGRIGWRRQRDSVLSPHKPYAVAYLDDVINPSWNLSVVFGNGELFVYISHKVIPAKQK